MSPLREKQKLRLSTSPTGKDNNVISYKCENFIICCIILIYNQNFYLYNQKSNNETRVLVFKDFNSKNSIYKSKSCNIILTKLNL
jgi:hypothetical protein